MRVDVRAGRPLGRSSKKPAGRSGVLIGRDLLTTREAALYTSINQYTLNYWRTRKHRRGPPFLKLHAHAVRYRLCDLEAFLENRLVEPARGAQPGPVIDWSPVAGEKK